MKIGYARISTAEQKITLQEDALQKAGCEKIFTDIISGSKAERKGLDDALSHIREGDTLIVWKLDRLGRSVQHLIQLMKLFNDKGILFQSIQENIDTSTSGGRLVFHVFCSLAEFERDLIRERTRAGLDAAKARQRLGGRPCIFNRRQVNRMMELYYSNETTVVEICQLFSISKPTFYKYLKSYNEKNDKKECGDDFQGLIQA